MFNFTDLVNTLKLWYQFKLEWQADMLDKLNHKTVIQLSYDATTNKHIASHLSTIQHTAYLNTMLLIRHAATMYCLYKYSISEGKNKMLKMTA